MRLYQKNPARVIHGYDGRHQHDIKIVRILNLIDAVDQDVGKYDQT
jgi:hypothetical protein